MGAVESCCGKRAPADFPMPPNVPINALGNQYVTFQHEEPEIFRMKENIWSSGSGFDVRDIKDQDWFKLEGRDAQWTQTKKLILNTGAHHCTVEKRGYLWHIYVGKERRATVVRDLEPRSQRHVFLVIQHQHPYPLQGAPDDVGGEEPRLVVVGDFTNYNYNFQEYRSMDRRRIATVHRSFGDGNLDARESYFVQVAAAPQSAAAKTRMPARGPCCKGPPRGGGWVRGGDGGGAGGAVGGCSADPPGRHDRRLLPAGPPPPATPAPAPAPAAAAPGSRWSWRVRGGGERA